MSFRIIHQKSEQLTIRYPIDRKTRTSGFESFETLDLCCVIPKLFAQQAPSGRVEESVTPPPAAPRVSTLMDRRFRVTTGSLLKSQAIQDRGSRMDSLVELKTKIAKLGVCHVGKALACDSLRSSLPSLRRHSEYQHSDSSTDTD